jgi:hypothetical protein
MGRAKARLFFLQEHEMTDNVVMMPRASDLLARQIQYDLERCKAANKKTKEGQREWITAAYDLCLNLAEAKRQHPALIEFGQWCTDNGFGEDRLHYQVRAVAIAMGQQPEALRKCLDATERQSLREIYRLEFPGFDSAVKTTKPSARKQVSIKTAAVRAAVKPLIDENKPVQRDRLSRELGVGRATVERAEHYASGRLDGLREAESKLTIIPLSPAEMKPTVQQRYEAALRMAKIQIRHELMTEVKAEVYRDFEDIYLKHWREKCTHAERIIASHKGVLSRKDFRIVLAGLHPDHNKFEQAGAAFELFKGLESVLVKPDAPVLAGPPLPETVEELLARRKTPRR